MSDTEKEERHEIETTLSMQLGRSGREGGGWHLRIVDGPSRQIILDADLTDKDLGTLLGTAPIKVPGRVRSSKHIGRQIETMSVKVPIKVRDAWYQFDAEAFAKEIDLYLERHGLEEWKPRYPLEWNGYKVSKTDDPEIKAYNVTLHRWVERVEDGS